jgi:hypothetical protein
MRPPSKFRSQELFLSPGSEGLAARPRKLIPHEFVLEAIASVSPWTRPMFGCLAVYVDEKIVLALRDKTDHPEDNGVWLATTKEHHESLRCAFPDLRSIQVLGKGVTGWQVLPADAANFEEEALSICESIVCGDPRIGKLPEGRRTISHRARKRPESSMPARKKKRTARKYPRK